MFFLVLVALVLLLIKPVIGIAFIGVTLLAITMGLIMKEEKNNFFSKPLDKLACLCYTV